MTHLIVKDSNSGSYLIAGKGHSFGSFGSWSEANTFIKEIEADNDAYKARQVAMQAQIAKDIADQEADRQAYLTAQRESDKLLYEGRLS